MYILMHTLTQILKPHVHTLTHTPKPLHTHIYTHPCTCTLMHTETHTHTHAHTPLNPPTYPPSHTPDPTPNTHTHTHTLTYTHHCPVMCLHPGSGTHSNSTKGAWWVTGQNTLSHWLLCPRARLALSLPPHKAVPAAPLDTPGMPPLTKPSSGIGRERGRPWAGLLVSILCKSW